MRLDQEEHQHQTQDWFNWSLDDNSSTPLYNGSSVNILQAHSELLLWYATHGTMSKLDFDRLLHLLGTVLLPPGNKLARTYRDAVKLLQPYIVKPIVYEACINDCCLFVDNERQQFSQLSACPTCSEPRYKGQTTIPRKTFKYIPLRPRLQRMFGTASVSALIQQHASREDCEHRQGRDMADLHDSPLWEELFSSTGPFQGDGRGLAFALCADGVNPFSRDRVSHSMWPITLSLLNLPKDVRNAFKSLLLVGVIPGPNEPKNMDTYLDQLVDELLSLSNSTMYDAVAREDFTVRLKVCLSILDYPGQNKVCKFGGAGAYAGCSHCQLVGEWSDSLKKIVYLENRRFLPNHDEMRESNTFPSSEAETRGPPEPKTQSYVEACNIKYEDAKTKVARSKLFKESGCKGRYSLQRLPEHDRLTDVPVEPMHTLKDCVEHLLKVSWICYYSSSFLFFLNTSQVSVVFVSHIRQGVCNLTLNGFPMMTSYTSISSLVVSFSSITL